MVAAGAVKRLRFDFAVNPFSDLLPQVTMTVAAGSGGRANHLLLASAALVE